MQTENQAKRIADLNDRCREHLPIGCTVLLTSGISALPNDELNQVLDKVRNFDAFTPGDDPYGEHDFGAFDHEGEQVYFKIDYYARDGEHLSENPADPSQTKRVLTIIFASEY
jgi:hypothetical protein